MREVAIVGAGELGGLTAHALARRNVARVVRLIDDRGRVAEGKALDISQAAPVEGFATSVVGSTDLSTAAGASVVVVAGHSEQGEDGLMLVRRLNAIAPRALFVCADTAHRELVDRSVRELHISRSRILGSASAALVAAATAIVALELDLSPRDVALSVLGVPPRQIVTAWESAAAAGFALNGMISQPVRRQMDQRIRALWPMGPYALAAAASTVVEALLGKSRRPVVCFVAPDDRAGVRTRTAALPARLGPAGLVEVLVPALSGAERVALDNAIML